MNHKNHIVLMGIGAVALVIAWLLTAASSLILLFPLICMGMMVLMMLAMGKGHGHDKE